MTTTPRALPLADRLTSMPRKPARPPGHRRVGSPSGGDDFRSCMSRIGGDVNYSWDRDELQIRKLQASLRRVDRSPDERTQGYFASTSVGFHDARSTDDALKNRVERAIADGRNLTAVYAKQEYEHALDASVPVATFAWFEKLVNVGGGRLVPGHLITWVTVRPTHRRRGR